MIKKITSVIYGRLLRFLNIKRDDTVIPQGMYCYTPDIEKNKNKKDGDYKYYVKTCKYYKRLGRDYNGCSYLGIITDDDVFGDQCKLCNVEK